MEPMKTAPYKLAFFGILITVLRIAMFVLVIDSGFGVMLSTLFAGAFAIFIAVGVYVSSFMVRYDKTRWGGAAGLVVFGLSDLWFNEATVIYYTSSAQLIPPTSNFLGINGNELRYAMQGTALGFGALPTIGAAVLAWMQSGTGKVAELNRPGIFARIMAGLGTIAVSWVAGIAIKIEHRAGTAAQDGGKTPLSDGQNRARRAWRSLTAEEVARIPGMNRAEMMAFFGVSDGTAGEWKRQVSAGERPWQK